MFSFLLFLHNPYTWHVGDIKKRLKWTHLKLSHFTGNMHNISSITWINKSLTKLIIQMNGKINSMPECSIHQSHESKILSKEEDGPDLWVSFFLFLLWYWMFPSQPVPAHPSLNCFYSGILPNLLWYWISSHPFEAPA